MALSAIQPVVHATTLPEANWYYGSGGRVKLRHATTLQARTCRFNPVAETGGPANSIRIASGAFDFEPLGFASATHEFSRTAISLEQGAGGFHGAFDERPRSFA
jgi:hypothetical protein